MAASLQKSFGAVGDSGASGLMQDAKVYAGILEHSGEDAKAAAANAAEEAVTNAKAAVKAAAPLSACRPI